MLCLFLCVTLRFFLFLALTLLFTFTLTLCLFSLFFRFTLRRLPIALFLLLLPFYPTLLMLRVSFYSTLCFARIFPILPCNLFCLMLLSLALPVRVPAFTNTGAYRVPLLASLDSSFFSFLIHPLAQFIAMIFFSNNRFAVRFTISPLLPARRKLIVFLSGNITSNTLNRNRTTNKKGNYQQDLIERPLLHYFPSGLLLGTNFLYTPSMEHTKKQAPPPKARKTPVQPSKSNSLRKHPTKMVPTLPVCVQPVQACHPSPSRLSH